MSLSLWLSNQARAMSFPFKLAPRGEVQAEVNHGRWLVRCPACAGAEEADPQEPVFYCLSCGNSDNDGHVMTVVFSDDRETIEKILLLRPMENRNWKTRETLQDLVIENLEHGFGVAGSPDFNSQLRSLGGA